MRLALLLLLALSASPLHQVAAAGAKQLTIGGNTILFNPPTVSRTQQFHIRKDLSRAPEYLHRDGDIALEPTLVSVSAERVKTALKRELGLGNEWSGKIYINIVPAMKPDSVIPVVSVSSPGGWDYTIQFPGYVTETKFIRAVTQALLLEIANRQNPSSRSAEIPVWLTEGFVQSFVMKIGPRFLMRPETTIARTALRTDPGAYLQDQGVKLLSFSELVEGRFDQTDRTTLYPMQATAWAFVDELLKLENGQAAMVATIRNCGAYWNWQTALLDGYRQHFSRLLDVDKWWSVVRVDFNGHASAANSPQESGIARLNATLQVVAHQRSDTNAEPQAVQLTLQKVVRQTPFDEHRETLRQKYQQLINLQRRLTPELTLMMAQYAGAIQDYVNAREPRIASAGLPLPPQASERVTIERFVRQLDELDKTRLRMNQELEARANSSTDPRLAAPERQR